MESRTIHVPSINCGHCTNTIVNEVGELEGVDWVEADVETKQVTVRFEPPASWVRIRALLVEIGFPPEP